MIHPFISIETNNVIILFSSVVHQVYIIANCKLHIYFELKKVEITIKVVEAVHEVDGDLIMHIPGKPSNEFIEVENIA